jgi:fido (protein-threonine AMPylation protein)
LAQTEIQSQKQSQQEKTVDISELEAISDRLWEIAQGQQSSSANLLQMLRVLESIHKRIRDDLFQPALPKSRHELFNLLRDIETNGGWPHIYRMKINEICQYLEQDEDSDVDA